MNMIVPHLRRSLALLAGGLLLPLFASLHAADSPAPAPAAATTPAPKVSDADKQYAALQAMVDANCAASTALAGEDWKAWEKARPDLGKAITNLDATFGHDGLGGTIKVALDKWPAVEKAPDFAKARPAYVFVSDKLAQIVVDQRKSDPRFAKLVVYYCPMTEGVENGRWMQKGGAMNNPFWGKDMLDCGSEVKITVATTPKK